MTPLTLLEPGISNEVAAAASDGGLWVSPSDVVRTLGWEVKPEGLCRNEVCIPLVNRVDLIEGDMINLGALARLIGRPLAVSIPHGAAYLGPSFDRHDHTVAHLEAPDFTLPDLGGKMHRLSDHRGSKVLLAAWASW